MEAISRKVACERLSALGLHQSQVYQILHLVQKWMKSEGPENTVKRLKVIKNLFVRKWSMASPIFPDWLKYRKVDGYAVPKGIFGSLFLQGMGRRSQKILSALMVYSTTKSTVVTPTQWKKFYESATADDKYLCRFATERNFRYFTGKLGEKGWNIPRKIKLDATVLVPNSTRAPFLDSGKTTLESEPGVLTRLVAFGCHSDPEALKVIKELRQNPDNDIKLPEGNFPLGIQDLMGGRIGFIQEPGMKLRVVANPLRHHQFILEPLKKVLLEALRHIDEDCTHDQDRGVYDIQGWLREGISLSSVDLSDATNLFPAGLTFDLLNHMFRKTEYERLCRYVQNVSRREWAVNPRNLPKGMERTTLRWTKGQPLGLGPSFPMFALSHHFVMMAVQARMRSRGLLQADEVLKYRILGDDIVMDARAEELYRLTMVEELNCKISEDKSLSNCNVAEFASRIISKDRILRQYKWKEFCDDNFVEVAKQYGTRQSFGLFPRRQRNILRTLSEIPSQFGGLGFNPKGLSLETRIANNLHHIRNLEVQDSGVNQRWAGTYRLKNRFEGLTYMRENPIYASDGSRFFGKYPDKGITIEEYNDALQYPSLMAEVDANTLLPGYIATSKVAEEKGSNRPTALAVLEKKLMGVNPQSIQKGKPTQKSSVLEQSRIESPTGFEWS